MLTPAFFRSLVGAVNGLGFRRAGLCVFEEFMVGTPVIHFLGSRTQIEG